ncbi:hypothetical protein CY35_06G025100 [Sphagnum magellanicum]|nr:hypothetical protein CY35_06G025100 [Sphagnum magellanicum]
MPSWCTINPGDGVKAEGAAGGSDRCGAAAELKDSSVVTDISLQDAEHVLDPTKAALELSLVASC